MDEGKGLVIAVIGRAEVGMENIAGSCDGGRGQMDKAEGSVIVTMSSAEVRTGTLTV
jgi:hypothetical protein